MVILRLQARHSCQVTGTGQQERHAIRGKGVGVVVEAQHMCMMMRGVEKQNSVMTTSCMLGSFRSQPQTRNEFLRLIG